MPFCPWDGEAESVVPFPLFLWVFFGSVINSMLLHQLQCLCMRHWWHGDGKGLNETSWGLCYRETTAFDKQSCQEHPLYSWSLSAGCWSCHSSGLPSFLMAWFRIVPKTTWMTQRLLQPQNGFGFIDPKIPVCCNRTQQDGWCRSRCEQISLKETFVTGNCKTAFFCSRRGREQKV